MPNREEELVRTHHLMRTREDTRAEADVLFGGTAKAMRQSETAKMRKLFVQAPVAQTMAPNLQGATEKTASASPAPHVDAFLEKLANSQTTEAQRRYPELLKVAAPRAGTFKVPDTTLKRPTPGFGENPTQSALSGGSA